MALAKGHIAPGLLTLNAAFNTAEHNVLLKRLDVSLWSAAFL